MSELKQLIATWWVPNMAELSSTELSAHAIIQRLELHARTHHFSGTDDLADKFLQECDELVHEWESGPKDQLKRGEVQKYFKREITLRELFRKLKHIEPEEFDDMYDGLPPDAQRHTTKTKVHRCRISKCPRKLRPSHLMQHRVRHSCLHTPNG